MLDITFLVVAKDTCHLAVTRVEIRILSCEKSGVRTAKPGVIWFPETCRVPDIHERRSNRLDGLECGTSLQSVV